MRLPRPLKSPPAPAVTCGNDARDEPPLLRIPGLMDRHQICALCLRRATAQLGMVHRW